MQVRYLEWYLAMHVSAIEYTDHALVTGEIADLTTRPDKAGGSRDAAKADDLGFWTDGRSDDVRKLRGVFRRQRDLHFTDIQSETGCFDLPAAFTRWMLLIGDQDFIALLQIETGRDE